MSIASAGMHDSEGGRGRRWEKVAPTNRFFVPKEGREAAPIVCVCRALLLEDELDAGNEYRRLVQKLEETPPGRGLRQLAKVTGAQTKTHLYNSRQDQLSHQFTELATPLFMEYATKWLFGNVACLTMLEAFSVIEVVGKDPMDIEDARAQSQIWRLFYGKHTTRADREARDRLRQRVEEEGWVQLDDATQMKYAMGWVRTRLGLEKSLLSYVKKLYPNDPEDLLLEGKYKTWWRKLSLIDDLIIPQSQESGG